ncbi:unnamed protein product [Paramecium sonneborni]|uniref:Uncharacterized protein n=1 Tax=Paramecium sonneborni TaxID=65129 RepID=A0A8S1K8R4_9CILI|nr:unnamed protein product [Paramecium sonneborni]
MHMDQQWSYLINNKISDLKSSIVQQTCLKICKIRQKYQQERGQKLLVYALSKISISRRIFHKIQMQIQHQIVFQNCLMTNFFQKFKRSNNYNQNNSCRIYQYQIYNSMIKSKRLMIVFRQLAKQIFKNQVFLQFYLDKKMLFINLTGIENCDYSYQAQFQSQLNYLYINFQVFEKEKNYSEQIFSQIYNKNFINIYLNLKEDLVISWEQFKLIYKLQIKKLIKKSNFNFCILSIAKSLNKDSQERYIRFEDECIRRMIEKFCTLSSDNLFIHLQILNSTFENQIEMTQFNYNQDQDFFRFLNCIQQGVIGNQIKSKKNFELDAYKNQDRNVFIKWLEEFVKIQYQMKMDPLFLNMYQRELRNIRSMNLSTQPDQFLKQSPLMILSYNTFFYLYYNQEQLQFLFNSILHIDYTCKLVVLLQQDEQKKNQYYLYWSDIKDCQNNIECQRIVLNRYFDDVLLIDSHKKASLSVKMQKISNKESEIEIRIIYIHSLNSNIILQIQLFDDPQINMLKRSNNIINQQNSKFQSQSIIQQDQNKISEQVKNRIVPCVIQNSPISDTDFMIVGGEFENDSQICNIIEIVKVNQTEFHSYTLQKEILFAKGTFIPWPYMIVLTSNKEIFQYIFLPGDYGNKQNCYNQPIVNVYQHYAYKLTIQIDNLRFQWQKLDIRYDIDQSDGLYIVRTKPILIQYFSGPQCNILQEEDPIYGSKWIIAKTINKPMLFGQKGKREFQIFMEDLDSTTFRGDIEQLIITAEIIVKENQLIVKEKFYKTQNQYIQKRQFVEFKNNNNAQNSN